MNAGILYLRTSYGIMYIRSSILYRLYHSMSLGHIGFSLQHYGDGIGIGVLIVLSGVWLLDSVFFLFVSQGPLAFAYNWSHSGWTFHIRATIAHDII